MVPKPLGKPPSAVRRPTYTRRVDERSGRRLARSTAIFSLATGLSRILGLVREIVASYYFGAAGKINAFTVAFQVPNLFRSLVADQALSASFVPVFSGLLETGDKKRAWRVASTLFWLVLLVVGGLVALLMVIAPLIIRPFGDPGGDPELAVALSRILFPTVVLLGMSGIVVGILNSYDHFTVPALSPVFWNIAIIAGLVIGVPRADTLDAKLYVYAGSILVGTVIQTLLPFPWLRGRDDRLRLLIDWRDPAVARVLKLMIPVTLSLGLINFNLVINSIFASRLIDPELAPTAIDRAFRLYMLPQGMFSVAVATVLFPALARLATRGDEVGFGNTVGLGLRQIGFTLLPASAVSAVLAEPITRLVYERGQFEPSQTPVVAGALAAFSAGLFFNGAMLMLNRAFFSLHSNWVPTLVALAVLGVNAVLDAFLYRVGTWGIPLATSLANVVGAVVLYVLLRRRLALDLPGTLRSLAKILLASLFVAITCFGVWYGLDQALGRSFLGQLVSVTGALAAGVGVYLLACKALKVRELGALLALRRRFGDASS
jgi:putative peptidoglycan lipid II flippase